MNNKNLLVVVLIGLLPMVSLRAQDYFSAEQLTQLEAAEDTLGLLSYAIINDSLKEHRFGAVQAFIPSLVRTLKTPNSFHYQFSQLQSISIQYPADSTFRIFTWQLYVDKDEYRYYGAIQMNTEELKLFPLIDRSFELEGNLEDMALTHDQWYGAVYYKLLPCLNDDQPYYLLFGFDGFEYFRKRKVIDVLTFQDGKPVFGAPVFVKTEKDVAARTSHRFLLEYSVEASVSCNYNEAMDKIIYDHLQLVGGNYGEGPTYIPDGTYEGFEFKEGQWHWIEKIFHQTLDEAPRPEPILNGRGKNILGGKGGK